jgi:RNA polymerase sigma-70 factor (ECF subfamily)
MNAGSDKPFALRFTHLWVEAQPAVTSALLLLVRDRLAVEDIQQEVALAAYNSFDSYDAERSFTGWVLGIAKHKAVDWMRRNAGARRTQLDMSLIADLVDTAGDMAGEFAVRELALQRCIPELSERSQKVLRLRYVEDMPHEAIAEATNLNVNNVKVVLHRARQALRACIERRIGLA